MISVFVVLILLILLLYVYLPLADVEDFFRVSVEHIIAKYEDKRFIEGILND